MGALNLRKGTHALCGGEQVVLTRAPTPLQAQVRFEDGRVEFVDPQDLTCEHPGLGRSSRSTHQTPDGVLAEAQRRYAIILPLLNLPRGQRTRAVVQARAEACRNADDSSSTLCAETLYIWMRHYEASGELLSLTRQTRKDKGKTHLPALTARLMAEQIEDYAPKRRQAGNRKARRLVFSELMISLKEACLHHQVQAPHPNTVRNALGRLDPLQLAKAVGSRKGEARHTPLPEQYLAGTEPLALAQIDHTLLDVLVVDKDGEPIGRPWLTLMIDVASRMVIGLHLSLYEPGAFTTTHCVAQAILPKKDWLKSHGLERFEWPCFGKIKVLHSDNGKDFWVGALRRALDVYGIDHHFRMVGKPHWGAHIEVLMGTVSKALRSLPGYVGPNTVERKDMARYDEEEAVMTMERLHEWVLNRILGNYHRNWHSGLKGIPEDVYIRGLQARTALPEIITGETARKLKIDFLPSFEAAITPKGVVFKWVRYYDHVLDNLIGVKEHPESRRSKTYHFHYNPHDMSVIYLYVEALGGYQPIRYADIRRPSVTLWEIQKGLDALNAEKKSKVDEDAIFLSVLEGRRILQAAASETRKARASRRLLARHKESQDRTRTDGFPPVSPEVTRTSPAEARALEPQVPDAQAPDAQVPDAPLSAPVPAVPVSALPDFPIRFKGLRA